MSIITFWNGTDEQVGTTSSSIAFATQVAMDHNIKVLLVSTGFNDDFIKDSFWQERTGKTLSIFSTNNDKKIDNSGIEGLSRIIKSNKVSPQNIGDYCKIVLNGRFDILLGYNGEKDKYIEIREQYPQVIKTASQYYDMVIVDLDKKLGSQTEVSILKATDVTVALVPQRAKKITKIVNLIEETDFFNQYNTVLAIGKYMDNTSYNAKNITRNLLKKKEIINTIPYNNLFFEATQEGKVIDLFLKLMRLKEKDPNYIFTDELKKLNEKIKGQIQILQMGRYRN